MEFKEGKGETKMIGGTVIETKEMLHSETKEHLARITCKDDTYSDRDILAVYTKPALSLPKVGDKIWWQCGQIFWSDQGGAFTDRAIPKIGYSHTPE